MVNNHGNGQEEECYNQTGYKRTEGRPTCQPGVPGWIHQCRYVFAPRNTLTFRRLSHPSSSGSVLRHDLLEGRVRPMREPQSARECLRRKQSDELNHESLESKSPVSAGLAGSLVKE